MYCQLEQRIRELRNRFQSSSSEGEQKVFYTHREFRDEVRLSDNIPDHDLVVALRFLHEVCVDMLSIEPY